MSFDQPFDMLGFLVSIFIGAAAMFAQFVWSLPLWAKAAFAVLVFARLKWPWLFVEHSTVPQRKRRRRRRRDYWDD
jgi:hypothetical protein